MTEAVLTRAALTAKASPIFDYRGLYASTPTDRIGVIKKGVPARKAKQFFNCFHLEQKVMFEALNLKTATVNKKAVKDEALSTEDSERVIGLAKLVGQVQAMVEESGDPEGFDVHEWLSAWLRQPLPAYGGVRPIDYLDTMEGQAMISRTLAQMQAGVYV